MSDAPPPPYPGPNPGYGAPPPGGQYPPPSGQYPPPSGPYPPPSSGYPAPAPYNDPYKQTGYSNPSQPGGGYNQPGGYGQPAGYAPQRQGGYNEATTVVVNQPPVTLVQSFRESPVHTCCPHCRAEVVTGIHYESGTFAWVICCVLWWVGLGLGCCLIPFCVDGCKDVIHTCPNCQQQIARFSRM